MVGTCFPVRELDFVGVNIAIGPLQLVWSLIRPGVAADREVGVLSATRATAVDDAREINRLKRA
jgi:hypothetical protein